MKILGRLVEFHDFPAEPLQRNAWLEEIEILKSTLAHWDKGFIILEFSIPRMGKRVDAVLLVDGLVFMIEFKVGEKEYLRAAVDQVWDYALDLKNFHAASHTLPIIPILVATDAPKLPFELQCDPDRVYSPLKANSSNLVQILTYSLAKISGFAFDSQEWLQSAYKPTPTIIEAAQALYKGHNVSEISRSESGSKNLTEISDAISNIIRNAQSRNEKAICFVTGVPGAGKTLAGLNIANSHFRAQADEYSVFLSGNGPLVDVLREALARDEVESSKEKQEPKTKKDALRNARAFIQNVHHFRDEALSTQDPLTGKIVVFDEAQRAWTRQQTAAFMKQKRGWPNFEMSEPEFLISVLNRQPTWAVIVCLIGGGQEINTGEAGLIEWFAALGKSFPHWHVYVSNRLTDIEYTQGDQIFDLLASNQLTLISELHLGVSNRSFRSENVSALVKAMLDLQIETAQALNMQVQKDYPIVLTRELRKARTWVMQCARGTERYGLLASSGATRLRPVGIDIKSAIEVEHWFLNDKQDVRSSFALEQAATEFDIQGLELDWIIVAWDADLRFQHGTWEYKNFTGAKWQSIQNEQKRVYLKNAYRVLLTRARQGIVIYVPHGNAQDHTRPPSFYDETFNYLKQIGFPEI